MSIFTKYTKMYTKVNYKVLQRSVKNIYIFIYISACTIYTRTNIFI